jgi:hypothetical protein
MHLKQTMSRPDSGQYVCIWQYEGKIWSETVNVEDGDHLGFDECQDEFVPVFSKSSECTILGYFILVD